MKAKFVCHVCQSLGIRLSVSSPLVHEIEFRVLPVPVVIRLSVLVRST
jgi:hypothetical protein